MRKKIHLLSAMLLLTLSLLCVACGSTSTASGSTSTPTATNTSDDSTPETANATATVQESTLIQQMMLVGSPTVKIDASEYTITGKIKNTLFMH